MISIICPVYNEEKYIGDLLSFFESIEPKQKEIFVVDGGSSDRTREIVAEYATRNPDIQLIDNPNRYVPFALNLAIPLCKGEIIVRWDAHTRYAPDYLLQIIHVFGKTGADIVGGPMRAVGYTPFQQAVAYATSTVLGVGNSRFHFENFKGYTDSVYLGAWKRSVFEKIGIFDEQMLRNQDDEFHYRARRAGLRIFQSPDIKSYYFPRQDVVSLYRQYFGYGLFKPLVLKKVKSEMKLRHLVPMLFIGYLTALPFIAGVHFISWVPLLLYFSLVMGFSWRSKGGFRVKLNCMVVYPVLHTAYGIGFWRGLFKS